MYTEAIEPHKYITTSYINQLKERKPMTTIPKPLSIREGSLHDDISLVIDFIVYWEGYSARPYKDSEGYLTIGHGLKLSNNKELTPDDIVIRMNEEISRLYIKEEIYSLHNRLQCLEVYNHLNTEKQMTLISMAYQLGYDGLMKFKDMWKALEVRDYPAAREAARDSLWCKQTESRCIHHSYILGKRI